MHLLKRHLFQQLLWSMRTNSQLSIAFAVIWFCSPGERVRDMHCTWCQHSGAQGQHSCILLGRLTASRDSKGIIQQEHFTPQELLSVFSSTLTQLIGSEKTCNRLLRTPDQMAVLPISSRTQPVQHRNTEISKFTPQSCTHLHTAWQECQITALQVWTIKATVGTKRWLSPKSRCCHSSKIHYCAQQQLESFLCAYLISDSTETPMWNCKQNRCTFSLGRFRIVYQNSVRFIWWLID